MNSDSDRSPSPPFYCDNAKFESGKIRKLQNERESIQAKTYRNWINSILMKARMEIGDIYHDLSDGIKLIHLLELITDEKVATPNRGCLKIHKLQNASQVLKFIKQKNVYLESIGPEDIVDENHRLILGLIWTIILRFQLAQHLNAPDNVRLSLKTVKESLLGWVQTKVPSSSGSGSSSGRGVRDFHRSWSTGWSFVELIRSFRSDVIHQGELEILSDVDRLETAFDIAKNHLDIPKILDAHDVAEAPDENSILTYVSFFHNLYCKVKTTDTSNKRIKHVIEVSSSLQNIKDNYLMATESLRQQIDAQCRLFETDIELSTAQNEQCLFEAYFNTTRRDLLKRRNECESLFAEIQTEEKKNSFKKFAPNSGQTVNDIEKWWSRLEALETKRKVDILNKINQCYELNIKMENFESKSLKIERYISDKVAHLNDLIGEMFSLEDTQQCHTHLKQIELLCCDILNNRDKHSDFFRLATELCANEGAPNHPNYVLACQRHIRMKLDKLQQMAADVKFRVVDSRNFVNLFDRLKCLVQQIEQLKATIARLSVAPFQPVQTVFTNFEFIRQYRIELCTLEQQFELIKTHSHVFFDNNNQPPHLLFDSAPFHAATSAFDSHFECCQHDLSDAFRQCTFNLKWNEFRNDIDFYESFFRDKLAQCLSRQHEVHDSPSLSSLQRRNNVIKLELQTIQTEFFETCTKGFSLSSKCATYQGPIEQSVESVKSELKKLIHIVNERTFLISDTLKLVQWSTHAQQFSDQIFSHNSTESMQDQLYRQFWTLDESEFKEFVASLDQIENLSVNYSSQNSDSLVCYLKKYDLSDLNFDTSHAYLMVAPSSAPIVHLKRMEHHFLELVGNNYDSAQKLFTLTELDFENDKMRQILLHNVENDLKIIDFSPETFSLSCDELEHTIDLYFTHNRAEQFLELVGIRKKLADSDVSNIRDLIYSVESALKLLRITNSVSQSLHRIVQHQQPTTDSVKQETNENSSVAILSGTEENVAVSQSFSRRSPSRSITRADNVLQRMRQAVDVVREHFDRIDTSTHSTAGLSELQRGVQESNALVEANLKELATIEHESDNQNDDPEEKKLMEKASAQLRRLSQTQIATEQCVILAQNLGRYEEFLLEMIDVHRRLQTDSTINSEYLDQIEHSTVAVYSELAGQFNSQLQCPSQISQNVQILECRVQRLNAIFQHFEATLKKRKRQILQNSEHQTNVDPAASSTQQQEKKSKQSESNIPLLKVNNDTLEIAFEMLETIFDDLRYCSGDSVHSSAQQGHSRLGERLSAVKSLANCNVRHRDYAQLQSRIAKCEQLCRQKFDLKEYSRFQSYSAPFVRSCKSFLARIENKRALDWKDCQELQSRLDNIQGEHRVLRENFSACTFSAEIQSKLIYFDDLTRECTAKLTNACWRHDERRQIESQIDKFYSEEFQKCAPIPVDRFRAILERIDRMERSFVGDSRDAAASAVWKDINLLTHKLLAPLNKCLFTVLERELSSHSTTDFDPQTVDEILQSLDATFAGLDRVQNSLVTSVSAQTRQSLLCNYLRILTTIANIQHNIRKTDSNARILASEESCRIASNNSPTPILVRASGSCSLDTKVSHVDHNNTHNMVPSYRSMGGGSQDLHHITQTTAMLLKVQDNLSFSLDTAFSDDKTSPTCSALSVESVHNSILDSECDSGHYESAQNLFTASTQDFTFNISGQEFPLESQEASHIHAIVAHEEIVVDRELEEFMHRICAIECSLSHVTQVLEKFIASKEFDNSNESQVSDSVPLESENRDGEEIVKFESITRDNSAGLLVDEKLRSFEIRLEKIQKSLTEVHIRLEEFLKRKETFQHENNTICSSQEAAQNLGVSSLGENSSMETVSVEESNNELVENFTTKFSYTNSSETEHKIGDYCDYSISCSPKPADSEVNSSTLELDQELDSGADGNNSFTIDRQLGLFELRVENITQQMSLLLDRLEQSTFEHAELAISDAEFVQNSQTFEMCDCSTAREHVVATQELQNVTDSRSETSQFDESQRSEISQKSEVEFEKLSNSNSTETLHEDSEYSGENGNSSLENEHSNRSLSLSFDDVSVDDNEHSHHDDSGSSFYTELCIAEHRIQRMSTELYRALHYLENRSVITPNSPEEEQSTHSTAPSPSSSASISDSVCVDDEHSSLDTTGNSELSSMNSKARSTTETPMTQLDDDNDGEEEDACTKNVIFRIDSSKNCCLAEVDSDGIERITNQVDSSMTTNFVNSDGKNEISTTTENTPNIVSEDNDGRVNYRPTVPENFCSTKTTPPSTPLDASKIVPTPRSPPLSSEQQFTGEFNANCAGMQKIGELQNSLSSPSDAKNECEMSLNEVGVDTQSDGDSMMTNSAQQQISNEIQFKSFEHDLIDDNNNCEMSEHQQDYSVDEATDGLESVPESEHDFHSLCPTLDSSPHTESEQSINDTVPVIGAEVDSEESRVSLSQPSEQQEFIEKNSATSQSESPAHEFEDERSSITVTFEDIEMPTNRYDEQQRKPTSEPKKCSAEMATERETSEILVHPTAHKDSSKENIEKKNVDCSFCSALGSLSDSAVCETFNDKITSVELPSSLLNYLEHPMEQNLTENDDSGDAPEPTQTTQQEKLEEILPELSENLASLSDCLSDGVEQSPISSAIGLSGNSVVGSLIDATSSDQPNLELSSGTNDAKSTGSAKSRKARRNERRQQERIVKRVALERQKGEELSAESASAQNSKSLEHSTATADNDNGIRSNNNKIREEAQNSNFSDSCASSLTFTSFSTPSSSSAIVQEHPTVQKSDEKFANFNNNNNKKDQKNQKAEKHKIKKNRTKSRAPELDATALSEGQNSVEFSQNLIEDVVLNQELDDENGENSGKNNVTNQSECRQQQGCPFSDAGVAETIIAPLSDSSAADKANESVTVSCDKWSEPQDGGADRTEAEFAEESSQSCERISSRISESVNERDESSLLLAARESGPKNSFQGSQSKIIPNSANLSVSLEDDLFEHTTNSEATISEREDAVLSTNCSSDGPTKDARKKKKEDSDAIVPNEFASSLSFFSNEKVPQTPATQCSKSTIPDALPTPDNGGNKKHHRKKKHSHLNDNNNKQEMGAIHKWNMAPTNKSIGGGCGIGEIVAVAVGGASQLEPVLAATSVEKPSSPSPTLTASSTTPAPLTTKPTQNSQATSSATTERSTEEINRGVARNVEPNIVKRDIDLSSKNKHSNIIEDVSSNIRTTPVCVNVVQDDEGDDRKDEDKSRSSNNNSSGTQISPVTESVVQRSPKKLDDTSETPDMSRANTQTTANKKSGRTERANTGRQRQQTLVQMMDGVEHKVDKNDVKKAGMQVPNSLFVQAPKAPTRTAATTLDTVSVDDHEVRESTSASNRSSPLKRAKKNASKIHQLITSEIDAAHPHTPPLSSGRFRRIFQVSLWLYLCLVLLSTFLFSLFPHTESEWNCLTHIDEYRRGLVRMFNNGAPPM